MKKLFVLFGIAALLFSFAFSASANTIASSTMWFEGSLTYNNADGSYSGTMAMINEATTGVGDGVAGFDVYARNGAWATYDLNSSPSVANYTSGQVTDHDAYKQAGGWGATWDPDCADWYNYQIKFDSGSWYLEYNGNVGNDGTLTGASAAPMSGTVNWASLIATETGTGAYYTGMGTAQDPGYSASFATSKSQSTAGAWDMDWSWGSDYVPLQYADFKLSFEELGSGEYRVSMTPTPEPTTMLLLGAGLVGLVGLGRKKIFKKD